jgi:hypothetical protein
LALANAAGRRGALRALGVAATALLATLGLADAGSSKRVRGEKKKKAKAGPPGPPGPSGPQGPAGTIQVSIVQGPSELLPNGEHTKKVSCPADMFAIGGGVRSPELGSCICVIQFVSSFPEASSSLPRTWVVKFNVVADIPSSMNVVPYVICAPAPP